LHRLVLFGLGLFRLADISVFCLQWIERWSKHVATKIWCIACQEVVLIYSLLNFIIVEWPRYLDGNTEHRITKFFHREKHYCYIVAFQKNTLYHLPPYMNKRMSLDMPRYEAVGLPLVLAFGLWQCTREQVLLNDSAFGRSISIVSLLCSVGFGVYIFIHFIG
jgi:hypothetical protein